MTRQITIMLTLGVLCGNTLVPAAEFKQVGIEPRGPIAYPGMKAAADQEGVQARGYTFRNDCQKPLLWQAMWIWLDDAPSPLAPLHAGEGRNAAVGMFRKEISLVETPQKVSAWLTADAKYRLYVNGRLVSRGPVDMGRDFAGGETRRWFYDARDLTPYFTQGKNVIAAEVFRQWPVGPTVSRGQPGLLFEADINLPSGTRLTVKSDASWRAVPAAQFPNPALYDASKEPAGWRLPGFDDSAWPACRAVQDRWSPLVPSEMPPLMETRYPVLRIEGLPSRTITADGSFRVVFDRVLSAYPTLKVRGGRGAVVTIKGNNQAAVVLGDGETCFEFPFMTEIAPAFTVELKNVKTPVEIVDVGANFTSQPLEYRGRFECSDERLNRIWKVARWAVQVCLQTHHLDSPNHQEPICDPGDYAIESMVNYYAFAQPWLARQDIRKFAWLLKDEKYHNFHTSYSIAWLQMLMDYYDYTGDKALVEEMSPYVYELLDTYTSWRGRNALISEAPNYMFMDWVDIGGFGCHHPPAVIGQGYLTALYYHGLEMASRVAGMKGDKGRVEKYAKLRGEIATAFNRELWAPNVVGTLRVPSAGTRNVPDTLGLYRDGKPFQTSVKPGQWLPADKDIETFSPHVNLLAVLYDLSPKERQPAIVERVLTQQPLNTQPWFMHWVFQAIDHAGLFDRYGTQQMRRWKIVPQTQSFHEMWNGGDLSHGWCSTPLVQMSARVLGVQPTSPGFATLSIRPALCDLTWAKGSVPTPHGDVAVSWKLGQDRLRLDVTVPAGVTAEVTVPVERFDSAAVKCDGRAEGPRFRVTAGPHHIEVAGKLQPRPLVPAEEEEATEDGCDALEADVVKDDLLHRYLARSEDHCAHTGGGTDASAVLNGTTRNGAGGGETIDDGKTFRGYGKGDWLTLRLKQPCDLSEIRTFAGHSDGRASQRYVVFVAHAGTPEKFEQIAAGVKNSGGGASEVRLRVKAENVVAVRFEFQNGPLGFNVYREINLIGKVTIKAENVR